MAAVGAHDDRLSILVTHASTYQRWCEATTSSPSNAAALRDLGYMPVVDVHAAVARTACGLLRRNFGPLPGTALRARRRRAALRGLVAVLLALFAAILVYYMQMLMWWSFGGHKSASSSSSEEGAAAQLSGGYVLQKSITSHHITSNKPKTPPKQNLEFCPS